MKTNNKTTPKAAQYTKESVEYPQARERNLGVGDWGGGVT